MTARPNQRRERFGPIWVAAFALQLASPAVAQTALPQTAVDSITVTGSPAGSTGSIGVNVAAGTYNQQANIRVIAIGDNSGVIGVVAQRINNGPTARAVPRFARIDNDAFANNSGMVAVNVAAGSENQQANLVVIALGFEGRILTDNLLSQTRASQQPVSDPTLAVNAKPVTEIGARAFADSSGLVQVSLVGGERNTSANIFSLTIQASGNF